MTVPFRRPPGRRLLPVCAALLAVGLAACTADGGAPGASPTSAAESVSATGAGETTSPAPSGPAAQSAVPSGNDVAPYDDTATRDAAAEFGSTQSVSASLDARVEGPRPATTGERPVRAAPGTPVQVFTLTLTNTGAEPVDALPWSFPVAVAAGEPAVPVFDESLGVRMETFPTIAPGESAALDVAFGAPHDADLAVRVFDNTDPDHYVEFTG
jgi:hypothetical protein